MRLRAYLVRRTIQTVITLVVFLVILFAIFRLMPGDPVKLFSPAGVTVEAQNELCVQYGLCKRVPAAGHAFETGFSASAAGPYSITAFLNDSGGNKRTAYFIHTNPKTFFGELQIDSITTDKDSWAYVATDSVTVTAAITVTPPRSVTSTTVNAQLQDEFGNPQGGSFPMARVPSTSEFRAVIAPQAVGFHLIVVNATETTGTALSVEMASGFAVNNWTGSPGDMGPFQLVEGKFISDQVTQDSARLSLAVTSSGGSIGSIDFLIRSPPPISTIQVLTALHPDDIVRRSIFEQFASYFVNMLTFNLGRSFLTNNLILDEIKVRIGPTLLLFGSAVIIDYVIGILIGAVVAWRRGSKMEMGTIVTTLFFYAMPVFWLGLVMIWIFAVNLNAFPLAGMGGFNTETQQPLQGFDYVKDVLWHMTLPLVTLVLIGIAGSILLMRSNMLEVMGEDYVTTAKAKGLTERAVVYKHAARNALLPVVTSLAISIGFTISGGVLTETVFSWPGMGQYLIARTLAQDYPAVQGAFFILAIITIIMNMIADILYAYLDPRVRL